MIYVDNAATTKISDSVFEKMLPFLREQYGSIFSKTLSDIFVVAALST